MATINLKYQNFKTQMKRKTHGGKRKGAGAKPKPEHLKKEKTKVMRIPVSKVAAVEELILKTKT